MCSDASYGKKPRDAGESYEGTRGGVGDAEGVDPTRSTARYAHVGCGTRKSNLRLDASTMPFDAGQTNSDTTRLRR
mgnify:CR=1 FL=1